MLADPPYLSIAVQVPVVASNRIGTEVLPGHPGPGITFYGGSFIAGQEGEVGGITQLAATRVL
jgi:predicted amidohydrolase